MSETSLNRFTWAADLLQIEPDMTILEIGVGAGQLAVEICSRLTKGFYIGLDKSSPMLQKAIRRNAPFISEGRSQFIELDFNSTDVSSQIARLDKVGKPRSGIKKADNITNKFDLIVAFNVNIFLKDQGSVLNTIHGLLKKNGKLAIFYQFPYHVTIKAAYPIIEGLEKNTSNR